MTATKKAVKTNEQQDVATDEANNSDALKALDELPEEFKGKSLQEIQLIIAQADLQMKMLELDRIRDENSKRIAKREALEKYNRQVQEQIESEQRLLKYAQSVCRHRQGGKASSDGRHVWSGDGPPCVARTLMLDGVTWLLQCIRCRKKAFTPQPQHYLNRPEQYAIDKADYDKMWELSADSGLDEIRGPTFQFVKDGVPFVPQRN